MIKLNQFDDYGLNLEILAEECAEVIQIKSKIRRFGLWSKHPKTNKMNRDVLIQEIGDVLAMIDILETQDLFTHDELNDAKHKKFEKLENYYNS